MKIKEINELLEAPEVKEVLEAAIQEQCKERQDALDKKIQELEESKAAHKKELFIMKKMLLNKANLYENKLKTVYEDKFSELSKKISTDVFNFVEESINKLTKAVSEDVATNSKYEKMQEAFSNAVRLMAPHFNINELMESTNETAEKLKLRLNASELENRKLRDKVLSDELEVLVVKECAGYPLEKKTIIVTALKEVKPKTLVEAKEAIETIKASLREATTVTESTAAPITESTPATKPAAQPVKSAKEIKSSLVALAEDTKKREQNKRTNATVAAGSIEPLDIF
jgi:hypothetical protein